MSKAAPPEPPAAPARDGRPTDWDIPAGGFDTYRQAAVHLRRPFTPAAVRFKIQTAFGPKEKDKPRTGALIVAYIDARLAVERLNLCVPHLWAETYTAVSAQNFLLCRLTIDGITREDVGESSKGFSKDLVSDALKRAAVHFGVGVSLYAIPQMKLFKEHIANGNLKLTDGSIVLTDKGDGKLRETYTRWLDAHGTQAYGPALDHGDREGHMDSPEAAAPETPVDPAAAGLADAAVADYQRSVKAAA